MKNSDNLDAKELLEVPLSNRQHAISGMLTVSRVRAKGLEPPRHMALDPKSSASTNSATPANKRRKGN